MAAQQKTNVIEMPTPMLVHAQLMAAQGFYVFPVLPWPLGTGSSKGKTPAVKFKEWATRDPETIRRWWGNAGTKNHKKHGEYRPADCNIGIFTSRFGDSEALVVIDVDEKHGKSGSLTLLGIELEGCDVPDTYGQVTPTGGRHLVFRCPEPLNQGGAGSLGVGLDIRSRGGFIIGAGSTINGKPYRIQDGPVAPAPGWLIERCGRAKEKEPGNTTPAGDLDTPPAIDRAIFYLEKEAHAAVEDGTGDDTAYKVAAHVQDFGISKAVCLDLLLTYWNDRCAPPWPLDELQEKVANSERYRKTPIGSADPKTQFSKIEPGSPAHWTAEMNEIYATVAEYGKPMVYRWRQVRGSRHAEIERSTHDDFAKLHRHVRVSAGEGKTRPKGKGWLDHPGHRHYYGVTFDPEHEAEPGTLNLWQGWTVEPAPGDWQMMQEHLHEVICAGDPVRYDYAVRWLAWKYQHPGQRPEVAFVMQGQKGTGKSIFANYVMAPFGQHSQTAARSDDVLGRFNEHLRHCAFLHCEEAFFPADPRQDGPLKDLVTGPRLNIEMKFGARIAVPNRLAIMMASNAESVVPASGRERRYFVTEVSDCRIQNHVYFDQLVKQMDNGGLAGMLYDLLAMDLTGFSPRTVPQTDALDLQKRHAARGLEGWLWAVLEDGDLHCGDFSGGAWPAADAPGPDVPVSSAHFAYVRFSRERGERGALPVNLWSAKLGDLLGSEVRRYRPRTAGGQTRHIVFGTLSACREAFAQSMRLGNYQWGDAE